MLTGNPNGYVLQVAESRITAQCSGGRIPSNAAAIAPESAAMTC